MSDVDLGLDHFLDRFACDVRAHLVVDLATGEDDLGVIAQLLRGVREVVGVHPDAMPADQAGLEAKRQAIYLRRVERP